MVKTRSGKSSANFGKTPVKTSKSVPKFEIFEDLAVENNPITPSKRKILMEDVEESKKPRPFAEIDLNVLTNLENTIIAAAASNVSKHPEIIKPAIAVVKIALTEDERGMNGAPEGEIFSVVVLSDADLPPLTEDEENMAFLHTQIEKVLSQDTNWAEKYEAMTNIRRVLVFRIELLDEDNAVVPVIAMQCVDAINSLRSTTVRNGLLCIQALLIKKSVVVWSSRAAASIIACLLTRCGSGPRFIVESAAQILLSTIPTHCPLGIITQSAQPLLTNKSPEVSSKAAMLIASATMSLTFTSINSVTQHDLHTTLISLLTGLGAKKIPAKDAAKKAILHLGHLLHGTPLTVLLHSLNQKEKSDLLRQIPELNAMMIVVQEDEQLCE
jgi:hypothetical protein